jgi:hypothetical protein
LNDPLGTVVANAVIVSAGTGGSVDVYASNTTDLVIDINGYYAAQTGITLAQGSAAAPSLSFAGDAGTGIFSSGAGVLNFSSGGTNRMTLLAGGDLDLPGSVLKGGTLFLHDLGADNTGVGLRALSAITTGTGNTANGALALLNNTTGNDNAAFGKQALFGNTTGSFNTALGTSAGLIITGDHNVAIANVGVAGESGAIRIGTAVNQTKAYIAGIAGVTVSNSSPVLIDTTSGQLGTAVSSRRFKQEIDDMGGASAALLQLRPVTFRYRQPGTGGLEYGLIAEEVAQVYPDLVARDADGQIQTVQYQKLTPMLLNELQRQEKQIQEQKRKLESLESLIKTLLDERHAVPPTGAPQ